MKGSCWKVKRNVELAESVGKDLVAIASGNSVGHKDARWMSEITSELHKIDSLQEQY